MLLGSRAFLVGSVVSDRENSARSLLLLGISYPLYRLIIWSRMRGKEKAA